MIVLGVDPGLARTGVAVVEGDVGSLRLRHAECVETAAGGPDGPRLAELMDRVERLVAEHRPEVAAVEQLFFASNRRSALQVSQARGVVLCVLARAGVTVTEYTPMQVKQALTGWGAASKTQVARLVSARLGVEAVAGPDDVADACAVAVCHHHRARLRSVPRDGRAALAAAVRRARAAS